jgi:hypothetical protein
MRISPKAARVSTSGFKENPMRAGKKIWGMERVPPIFNQANNCKDPRYQNRTH